MSPTQPMSMSRWRRRVRKASTSSSTTRPYRWCTSSRACRTTSGSRRSQSTWAELFYCCRAAVPYLKQRPGAAIVNISSSTALTGGGGGAHYAASKAARHAPHLCGSDLWYYRRESAKTRSHGIGDPRRMFELLRILLPMLAMTLPEAAQPSGREPARPEGGGSCRWNPEALCWPGSFLVRRGIQ
jgi:hypothetical protein